MRMGRICAFESLEIRRLFSMTVTSYNPANPLSTLTNPLIVPSTGITLTGSSYVGQNAQGGTYSGFNLTSGSTNLSIPDGVLLTSGSAAKAIGP